LSLLSNSGLRFGRNATMRQTMPGSVRQSATRHPGNPQSLERCPDSYFRTGGNPGYRSGVPTMRYVIPAKAGIHVWTRPDVKDVLKA
jgi:hypothetical protein